MERVQASDPATRVEVARVVRPHGLEGALVLSLYGDDPTNLLRAEAVRLEGAPGAIEFQVRLMRAVRKGRRGERIQIYARLAALHTRDQAEAWVGAAVSIPASALQPPGEGEYYWRDLLGLACRTLDGRELGVVEEIWPTGSNDVLVVRAAGRETLVPALRDVLARVDLQAGILWIDPPKGLLEP
jgi:16S rRNA processing protein RimM